MTAHRIARRAVLSGLAAAPLAARAQGAIQIVVPFPPGGASDLIARYAARRPFEAVFLAGSSLAARAFFSGGFFADAAEHFRNQSRAGFDKLNLLQCFRKMR